ncbi:guanylate kinase [Trichoderma citrinoviride]|uniref:guanylate kinase n=1 Tax=Trichoderma citrinoviride TaxID=58853 RepID=A0A2T4AYB6_9HYPO|nr:guanylate kinase [Trichoderma citrinoviride]PTB62066.1 guanylate kinase [Trichoderma citrinoviride]
MNSSKSQPNDVRPIIISGPSGVGKGTLIQMLENAHPGTFTRTVSHTTRQPRDAEAEGSTYFYVSKPEFQSLISQNAFIEYTYFSGNYYGTSRRTVAYQTAEGLVVVLEIDVEGVKQLRETAIIDARYVLIEPPSLDELEARLRQRSTKTEVSIEKKLGQARCELEQAETSGLYDMVLVNEDLDASYKKLEAFIWGLSTD